MRTQIAKRAPGLIGVLLLNACALAQQTSAPANHVAGHIDPRIARQIDSILAIDNHAHPVLPPPNDATDREFDALPVDNMEPETDTMAWRPDNPQLLAAWKALWGFVPAGGLPLNQSDRKRLTAARQLTRLQHVGSYDAWLLDRAGIGTMLANRVAMGPGLYAGRFDWVPYADALLFPLNNSGLAAENPDRALFFPMEDKLRARYLAAQGKQAVPPTLDEYLDEVVLPTLRQQRRNGAVAEKFEVAYLRSFDFADVSKADAARVYAHWALRVGPGAAPDPAEYKQLQDFLFRFIAAECGRLGMAVHLHTMAGGGGYFHVAGANPLLLEPVFDDPRLRKTNFVMLHGGWPFVREAGALLQKPNVYLDISQQDLSFSPRTLAGWLREWLETYPDKVLFATDGYPYSDAMGWEESTWMAAHNGREALGLALTGMVDDGEISRDRAAQIVRLVLRENAEGIYGSQPAPNIVKSSAGYRTH